MINCKNCKADSCAQAGFDYACDHCGGYVEPTNADKIRNMSDEELAEWLTFVEVRILEKQPSLERPALKADWLDWLRQEVNCGCSD